MKNFYRVSSIDTDQGLWYDFNGNFTGFIHNKFKFCKNSDLKMPFDPELFGFLSAATSIKELHFWFTKKDIYELQKHGYRVVKYKANKYRFYEKFQHYVIDKHTSELIEIRLVKKFLNYYFYAPKIIRFKTFFKKNK